MRFDANSQRLVAFAGRDVVQARCRWTKRAQLRCRKGWKQTLAADIAGAPLIVGEQVIVGGLDTHLYSFDLNNGHLKWRNRIRERIVNPPLLWRDRLVVSPANSANILLLNRDGVLLDRIVVDERRELFSDHVTLAGDMIYAPVLALADQSVQLRAYDLRSLKQQPANEPTSR